MGVQRNRSDILIVEYDDVDYELILEALKVIGLNNRVLRAIDGAEALKSGERPDKRFPA